MKQINFQYKSPLYMVQFIFSYNTYFLQIASVIIILVITIYVSIS